MTLRFGYGTNGMHSHRLDDALAVLAGLGYDGVALTPGPPPPRPVRPRPRGPGRRRGVAAGRGWGSRSSSRPGPATCSTRCRKHHPTLLDVRPEAARRIDYLHRAVEVAADLGAEAVSFWSGTLPPGLDPETAWARLTEGVEQVLRAGRAARRGLRRRARAGACSSTPSTGCSSCAAGWATRSGCGSPSTSATSSATSPAASPRPSTTAGSLLANVQVDDMVRGVHEHLALGDGEVDLPAALAALADVGYARPGLARAAPPHPRRPRLGRALAGRTCARPTAARRHAEVGRPVTATTGAPGRARSRPHGRRSTERCCPGRGRPPAHPGAAPGGRPRGGRGPPAPRERRATPGSRTPYGPAAAGPGRRAGRRTLLDAEVHDLYRFGDADERRAVLLALLHLGLGGRAVDLVHDALRTNDPRLVAAALGPYATAELDDAAWRQGDAQVPVRRGAARGWCRASRTAPTTSWPGWSPTTPTSDGRRAGRAGRRPAASSPPTLGRPDAHLRPPHPHDLAHHRRLRGDARRRGARAGRAGVLAGPAADQRRLVRRLLRRAGRLGAVPGRAVRHRPPLHDRAQPQGGQRPAVHAGARPAAALPGQGRCRRGRRGRLRLDDARGGEGVRPPAGARVRVRAARRWCTPRTATSRPAPAAPWTSSRAVGPRARQGAGRPPQRGDRRRGRPAPAPGWASPSTPTPRWTRDRMVAILQRRGTRPGAGQLGRRLGPQRPADHASVPARRCWRPASPTTTSTACCGATRSSSTARAAGCCSTCPTRTPRRPSPATRCCAGERLDEVPPPRRQPWSTSATAATSTPPRRSTGILDQLRDLRGAVRARARRAACSASACGCPPTRPPSWPPTRRGIERLRRRAGPARPRGGHPQRLPLPALPRPGGQARRLPPDWTDRGPPRLHRRLRPGAGRAAARRRGPRQHLHAAAGLAQPVVRRPRPARAADAARPSSAEGLAAVAADTGRTVRVGSSPSRAAWWRPPRRGRPGCAAWTPSCSACAWTPATSPPASRTAPRRSTGSRGRAAGGQGAGVGGAARRRPVRPGDPGGARRRTPRTGSCTRPGSSGTPRRRAATTSPRRSRAGGRCRRSDPGGCTSTCPCTPDPDAAAAQHPRPPRGALGGDGRRTRGEDRPPGGRDLHLAGAAGGPAPPATPGLVAGIAAEVAWVRDRLLDLADSRSWPHERQAAGGRRRRHDPASCWRTCRGCAGSARVGLHRGARHRAAGGHLRGAVDLPDRHAHRASTGSSATAGTSATSARCCCGASTTRWCRARSCGTSSGAAARATGSPTSAGGTPWAPTSTRRSRRGPVYHADGRKSPDCWTWPPELHDRLTGELGAFPLFSYWGPTASIASSRWIVDAARSVLPDARPDAGLRPAPRLRPAAATVPAAPEAVRAAREVDARARAAARRRRGARA